MNDERPPLRLVGDGVMKPPAPDDPAAGHPSRQERPQTVERTSNVATTAGVFMSLADGLESGRITPKSATLVLREYARMLWESGGNTGEPERVELNRKRPHVVATRGKGWAAWLPNDQDRLVSCPHVHRSRDAAERCRG